MREDRPAISTNRYPWRIFWVLVALGLGAGLCAFPYILTVYAKTLQARGKVVSPLPVFLAIQTLNLSLIFGLACGIGLLLAAKVDLQTPLLRAWLYRKPMPPLRDFFRTSIFFGLLLGVLTIVVLDFYVIPRVPAWPTETAVALWKRALFSFSGVDEELLSRLLFLSFVLWLTQIISRRSARSPILFWIVNCIVIALLVRVIYLPASGALVPLTAEVIVAVLITNALSGLIFGYLFWSRGLESAMLAHFVCDFLMHTAGPFFAPR